MSRLTYSNIFANLSLLYLSDYFLFLFPHTIEYLSGFHSFITRHLIFCAVFNFFIFFYGFFLVICSPCKIIFVPRYFQTELIDYIPCIYPRVHVCCCKYTYSYPVYFVVENVENRKT